MAARLAADGLDVTVWNRSPERTDGFDKVAATPREAAEGADFVILMVTNGAAVDEVTRELPRATTVIDMSTSGPATARRLGERFDAVVDAPVGGSLTEAESGTLAIFAGGDPAVVDRVSPVLERLGEVHRMGPLGSGQTVKVIGNLMMLGNTAVAGEALRMAEEAGLDPERALPALVAGPGSSGALQRKGRTIVDREFGPPARFRLRHALKDAELAREMGAGPFADLVAARLREGVEQGRGEQDYSALADIR